MGNRIEQSRRPDTDRDDNDFGPDSPASSSSDHARDGRMQRYSELVVSSERGEVSHPTPAVAPALETLRWYQDRLLELEVEASPVDASVAWELTRKRDWALYALIDHSSKGWAKERQLEITAHRPLAICTGGGPPIFGETQIGVLGTDTQGCFNVFEEAGNVSGTEWPRLCADCRRAVGHRNTYRDAPRGLRARVTQYLESRRDI